MRYRAFHPPVALPAAVGILVVAVAVGRVGCPSGGPIALKCEQHTARNAGGYWVSELYSSKCGGSSPMDAFGGMKAS